VWLLAAYKRTHSPGLLALAPFHIHYMNWVNSRTGSSYDDSTINIISLIIIIINIIIIIIFALGSKGSRGLKAKQKKMIKLLGWPEVRGVAQRKAVA